MSFMLPIDAKYTALHGHAQSDNVKRCWRAVDIRFIFSIGLACIIKTHLKPNLITLLMYRINSTLAAASNHHRLHPVVINSHHFRECA